MKTEINVAGITFAMEDNPELKTSRPFGAVTLTPEPNNQFDDNAIRVDWNGIKLGYIPAKGPHQDWIHGLINDGEAFSAEIKDYSYRDGKNFNTNHEGILGSVTISVCTEGEWTWELNEGRQYQRLTSVLKTFWPDTPDRLMRWAMNKFSGWNHYREEMNELAEAGTRMHDALEKYFKGELNDEDDREHLPAGLVSFLEQYKVTPISFEERLYDKHYGVCGKYDMLAEIYDKTADVDLGVVALDWKSSKAVRTKHKLQACWYAKMANAQRAMVVAFGKGCEVWHTDNVDEGYEAVCNIVKSIANAQRL
jgi:hypothetical protein